MNIRKYIKYGAVAALAAICAFLGVQAYEASQKNAELEEQLKDLTDKEKRSVVLQSISTQLEEIAYQQKEVSDIQREEAVTQTQIANEMRHRSEVERQNALEAERNAVESEKRAVEASRQAESQRILAEQQREEAEYARRVADTLSYLALARSLGSLAVTQENTGNHELASLLAYSSYLFTDRYEGDLYQPAIYEALSIVSNSHQTWQVHTGPLKHLDWLDDTGTKFITLSSYGEMFEHKFEDGKISTKVLFKDNAYDIRDAVVLKNGMIYAVSRTGSVLMVNPDGVVDVKPIVGAVHPFRIYKLNDTQLIVVAENGVYVIGQGNLEVDRTIPLEASVYVSGERNGNELLLFNNSNQVTVINQTNWNVSVETLPFQERVLSYTWLESSNTAVYGTYDGVVIAVEPDGRMLRLVGHRSRVPRVASSRMSRNTSGERVVTTGYDGTVKLWNLNQEKLEPMNVYSSNSWVECSSIDQTGNYLWTGDQNGNLTRTLISVQLLGQLVKNQLTRNFTREEWNYYIGNNIPYETFTDR